MFRDLIRKNKKLSEEECIRILKSEKRGILSVNGDDGYPYGMPMNHWYNEEDGCIYFHCGPGGHRLDSLKKHNNIAFNTLFSYYLYSIGKLEEDTENIVEHKADFVPSLVLNIISYLKENYKEPITLDYLSHKFSVSKATLIYNFNKYLHSSPVDYLINIRIQQAKAALTETNCNLSEIAESCGFSNANYFSLMFKRKVGLSPANYRKYKRES